LVNGAIADVTRHDGSQILEVDPSLLSKVISEIGDDVRPDGDETILNAVESLAHVVSVSFRLFTQFGQPRYEGLSCPKERTVGRNIIHNLSQ